MADKSQPVAEKRRQRGYTTSDEVHEILRDLRFTLHLETVSDVIEYLAKQEASK